MVVNCDFFLGPAEVQSEEVIYSYEKLWVKETLSIQEGLKLKVVTVLLIVIFLFYSVEVSLCIEEFMLIIDKVLISFEIRELAL